MAFHGLPLSDAALEALQAGAPAVGVATLDDPQGVEPGRPVRLLDRRGEAIASGVADPENGVVQVFARHPVRGFDADFFAARVEASLSLRSALGLVDGASA